MAALTPADAKVVWTSDVVPAPTADPANPTWQAVSYLREILAQTKLARDAARAAATSSSLAELTKKVDELATVVATLPSDAEIALAIESALRAALQDIHVAGTFTLSEELPQP